MAKLSQIAREKKRERLVKLKREKRAMLKEIIRDPRKSEEDHLAAQIALNKMPKKFLENPLEKPMPDHRTLTRRV